MNTVIEPLSNLWWNGLLISVCCILTLLYLSKKKHYFINNYILKIISILLAFSWLYGHYSALFIHDTWSLKDNLPLHLCRISIIIAIINSWYNRQWMYEWLLFLSIPSGIHSLITPELTQGSSPYLIFDFYFVHAALIFVPLFYTLNQGFRPRRNGWFKSFLYLQIPFLIIFPINFWLSSNYMYLAQKPIANNPFLFGEWPWYILGLEIVILMHIASINIPFYLKKDFSK